MKQFESFTYQDHTLKTQFIETMNVTDGVTCDVYIHPETEERDLGIITIQPGYKTPLAFQPAQTATPAHKPALA